MKYALEIKGLNKAYDNFCLEDVNISLPEGSIVGLIGENGAGKSTVMKSALNLVHRDSGEVFFWGKELKEDSVQLKEDIGVVFDEINFYETMTPAEVGKVGEKVWKNWDKNLWKKYMSDFSLPGNKKIKEMSKGMQVKLALAAALSHHAKLLILDEPTSGLDPVIRDDILDIFLEHIQEEKHSILLSSHITDDLEKVADYIVFIHKGKIILCEKKDELIYHYGIIRCSESDMKRIDEDDILARRKSGYQWNVLVKDKKKKSAKYQGLIVDNTSLNEIMLMYVKGEKESI